MLENAQPKPRPRATEKRANRRVEAKIKRQVRETCVKRDGPCRFWTDWAWGRTDTLCICDGPSEWAHLVGRYKTRGLAPEVRHSTRDSLMLCRFHHAEHHAKRLAITALSERGADGPLEFRRV